jgi:hypothetical protein
MCMQEPKSHLNIFYVNINADKFYVNTKKYQEGRCPPDIFYAHLYTAQRCINGS